jgi:hypothetical protein
MIFFRDDIATSTRERNSMSRKSGLVIFLVLLVGLFGCSGKDQAGSGQTDAASPGAAPVPPGEEWTPLFNGQNLDGWIPKFAGHELGTNYLDTFQVEDGLLKVSYEHYEKFDGEFGHLIYKEPFSRYILRVEYRFVGEQTTGGPSWGYRNSGVMLHGQPPESMAVDQNFPVSIEAQFLGGDGTGERPTANLCTPGMNVVIGGELVTRHCTNSSSDTFHGDRWVLVEIEVRGGGVIRHIIDGRTVMEYEQPQLDPSDADAQPLIKDTSLIVRKGYISLQAESHPLEFRRVEIKILED